MFNWIKDPSFPEKAQMEMNLGGTNRHIDGGLNLVDLPYSLDSSQSPDLCNMWFYDGALRKRWGQKLEYTLNTGAGFDDVCRTLNGQILILSHGKIYSYDPVNESSSLLYTLASGRHQPAPKGKFIRCGEDVYFVNGNEFFFIRNNTVQTVTPYIPMLYRNCDASTGSGTAADSPNLLTNQYRLHYFTSTSSSTIRIPNDVSFTTDPISVKVNGNTMSEGSGVTFSRETKLVRFSPNYPANANIEITLTASDLVDPQLAKCTFGTVYGSESRLILGGNGTNCIYYAASFDPLYFPQGTRLAVGNGDPVVGFGLQYNILAVFKKSEIAAVSVSGSGLEASILNPFIGCDMPGSIANLGNRLVFANSTDGVHIITSSSLGMERNVVQVSRNVNPRLLAEPNLSEACATVFDGRYWLCVNGHVYLWDNDTRPLTGFGTDSQRNLAWYYFEGISAGKFFAINQTLFYGEGASSSANGRIIRFINDFTDFGDPIPAHWRSAVMDFGHSNGYKTIERVWFIARSNYPSYASIKYLYDVRSGDTTVEDPNPIDLSSFNWRFWRWDTITWAVPGFFKTYTRRPRRRRVIFFSVMLENNRINTDLSIVDISIQYRHEYGIK